MEFGHAVFILLVILAIVWVAVRGWDRSSSRPCPRCGQRVPKGQLDCAKCGFDFRTIGSQS
jgi:hypothetical protein